MLLLPVAVIAFSLSQTSPVDWINAQGSGNCSATDVDVIAARSGIASCAFGDAMITSNGGLNWSVFPTQLQQSLVFSHAGSPTEFFLARRGLFRSTNSGASWTELGNLSSNPGSVIDVHFEGARMVALQGGFVRYSDDAGAVWEVGFPATQDVFVDELHFPGGDVAFASGGITSELGSIGSVLRSDDGGTSWTRLGFPFGQIAAADFRDASHGVAATHSSRVYATADGALNWLLIGQLPDSAYLTDLAQRSSSHWIGTSLSGCIFESLDGGINWSKTFCDPAMRALTALSLRGGAAVAVGSDGLAIYENRIFRNGFQ